MALAPARPVPARPAMATLLLERLAIGIWTDVLLAGTLLALAGMVRWPHLLLSPQFPSVGDTVMMALDVAEGRAFYLHDSAPYLGAPFLWLLALVYRVAGPSLEATQVLAWALGTLTIVPTYLLGREVGGRGVGLIAAAFLATSGAHTVVTSHVALSHSLTPLVSTTALWLVARAARRAGASLATGGRLLAAGGLLAGLALQTHPTVAPLLVGAAFGVLLMRPGWLRTRWPIVALALVLVGYSTLLVYHLTSRFEIVADVQSKQERYLDADEDAGEVAGHGIYLNNLEQLGISTARLISGALVDQETTRDYFSDPWVLATVALTVAGLGVAIGQRCWWLAIGVALAVLLPPAFSGKYRPVLDGRYLMPLVPVLFVAIGLAVAAAARLVAETGREVLGTRRVWRDGAVQDFLSQALPRLARGAALLVLAGGTTLLVAHPLIWLDAFYKESQEDGFSNALYLRTFQQVTAARADGEVVLLDPLLMNVKSTGGGKASSSFTFLLALAQIPEAPLDTSDYSELAGRLAILHRSTADRLDRSMQLEPLDGKRPNGKDSPSYRAYRIGTIEAVKR
jgi:hypothetical protein